MVWVCVFFFSFSVDRIIYFFLKYILGSSHFILAEIFKKEKKKTKQTLKQIPGLESST